jgi:hypothetical protein
VTVFDPMNNSSHPAEPHIDIAVELERIRRSVDVGFSDTRGSLNLLLQRADQTDKAVAATDQDVRDLDARVTAVEQKVWAAFGAAAVVGTIGGTVVPILFK